MTPKLASLYFVLVVLLSLSVWGSVGLTQHLIVAIDKWGNSAPDFKPTLDAISGPRGTLHEINKVAVKIGDAVVTTQLQERSAIPHVNAAMDQFGFAASRLSRTADSLSGTANALTGTAQAATGTLNEGQRTIAAAQPLLSNYSQAGYDLDELLKRKAIGQILDHAAGILDRGDNIAGDAQRVSDDLTRRYFLPEPWYKKVGPFAELGAKVGNKALGLW
jgi:hypothetical protein